MPRYIVKLTDEERIACQRPIRKGGKGYRIRHAQILLRLDKAHEDAGWAYGRIMDAYDTTGATVAGIARRFVFEGPGAALGRRRQESRSRKAAGGAGAHMVAIACSKPPEGSSRWTMQMIADELIRLEVVEYITDSTVCEVMKKTKSSPGGSGNGAYPRPGRSS